MRQEQGGIHMQVSRTGDGLTGLAAPGQAPPLRCPCCGQPVNAPTAEIVIDVYGLTDFEARILRSIWRGRGLPVQAERIFDAMYADDPDGGPSRTKMYDAFKVALCRLRKRIAGSGVSVETVGYRQGYRLVMRDRNHDIHE